MLRDIAAVVDNGDLDHDFVRDALAFANLHDAHLTFVIVSPSIPADFAMLPDLSYFELLRPEERTAAKAARLTELSTHGRIEVRALDDDPELVLDTLSAQARYADLVLFGAPDAYGNGRFRRRAAETIALSSGRPVFLVPPHYTPRKWDHIVVGWDASRAATRALNDALAVAEPGAKIDVAIVDSRPANEDYTGDGHGPEPGADIARHLARRGYDVAVHLLATEGGRVADELMILTKKRGAGLLVVGVIAHSAFHKFIVGGVASDVLHESAVPVLLAS